MKIRLNGQNKLVVEFLQMSASGSQKLISKTLDVFRAQLEF